MNAYVIWRLTPQRHADEAFTGEGAAIYGGRWNLIDVPMVYCAETRALAALEVLVNIRNPKIHFAMPWVALPAEIADELIEKPASLPDTWRANPYSLESQSFGTDWIKAQRSVALRVPSSVILGEFNYLLNPAHPQFAKIKVGKPEPFSFDLRLAQPAQRR
ncbi:MAG: RES family NAD+ phosphorylase [bacterium]|nr:RES family NAD+ phosphorylase [bacterium]MDI1337612.1 RES family NAD+ phosphorylase [Lacunisphaera sp.]